ncbi:MAG TPA: spermidine/putrescine ABC transporter substrate-binding protein [Ruminococcaceae bacterium]|nr:spermidine/putrescine ABC transporter substrate-binding protein [Oscillospiraceae bacterium]
MKKIISILLAVLMLFTVCLPVFAEEEEVFSDEVIEYYKNLGLQGTKLNVYNWGEYIDDEELDVISQFERLTGCEVNYTTFESNENMYSKLSGGGVSYDIIIPSDYMIEKLVKEDMLETLDYGNIPNYEKYFDKEDYGYFVEYEVGGSTIEDYAVIYNIGTTILLYNKNYIKEEPDSWSILWDEQYKGKVLMFNNPRDSFAIAQAMLGQDFNTESTDDWDAAANLLLEQRQKVKPTYVMDEIFNLMESGDYYLGVYYAGDYELMKSDLEEKGEDFLGFAFPKEGVNTFYDAMCIPNTTQNKRGAEAFINFMLEPEVALANAEYIYYASANTAVIENEDYSLSESEAVYPDEELIANAQQFHDISNDNLQYMSTLWMKVKGSSDSSGIYIAFFACIIAIAVVIVITVIKKKKMTKYYNV